MSEKLQIYYFTHIVYVSCSTYHHINLGLFHLLFIIIALANFIALRLRALVYTNGKHCDIIIIAY